MTTEHKPTSVSKKPEKSWLIQRLEKPRKGGLLGGRIKDNPFSFGGGYKNGGLPDEAMDLIRDIWSFLSGGLRNLLRLHGGCRVRNGERCLKH